VHVPHRIVRPVSREQVEVVERLFALYAESGVEGVLEVVSEDVVIDIPPDLSAEPDTYHGHDGVRRYFGGFAGMLEEVGYVPLELVDAGDYVLARARMSGRGVSSGLDVELETVVLHEFSGGKIVLMRPYADMDAALEAIGR
jgi:ketosteroid isomerase-like protein